MSGQTTRSFTRTRRSTGEVTEAMNTSGGSSRRSLPLMQLQEVIDNAKMKFENDQNDKSSKMTTLTIKSESPSDLKRKSTSAPASPGKSLSVAVVPNKRSRLADLSPRGRKATSASTNLLMPASNNKAYSKVDMPKNNEQPDRQAAASPVEGKKGVASKKVIKGGGVSMSEVIRLHQDEGVINLLHALPATRRRPSATHHVNTATPAAPQRRRPSHESERGQPKGLTQGQDSGRSALRTVLQRRHINPDNIFSNVLDPASIRPCSQEELMTSANMEVLKQLPTQDYVRLWSSPSRYVMAPPSKDALPVHTMASAASTSAEDNAASSSASDNPSQASPSGSVTSLESSVSKTLHDQPHRPAPFPRIAPQPSWKLPANKSYKDIHIRIYSSFIQIILTPSTCGLRNSINANVCDELIDVLKDVENTECRAVLLTGLGGTFCQGVDLTTLTHEGSADKQKRAAELLGNAIKRLIKQLLASSKVLVAAVNGKAVGFGVTMLPYFDMVYINDKAEFSMDYARIGQIPDGFASQTNLAQCHEMLFLGHTLTASMMTQTAGIVTEVVWPAKFLETIVPKMESLEFMNAAGLKYVKQALKKSLRSRVQAIMDEETKSLIAIWSSTDFAKNLRLYLKSSHLVFQ